MKTLITSFHNIIGREKRFLTVGCHLTSFNVIYRKLRLPFFFKPASQYLVRSYRCTRLQKINGDSETYKILFLLGRFHGGICTNLISANISFSKSLNSYSLYFLSHITQHLIIYPKFSCSPQIP